MYLTSTCSIILLFNICCISFNKKEYICMHQNIYISETIGRNLRSFRVTVIQESIQSFHSKQNVRYIKKEDKSDIIYRINCTNYENYYIG